MNHSGEGLHDTGENVPDPMPDSHQHLPLRRPVADRMLAGVCVAVGQHLNIDVTIVRVTFSALTLAGFTGLAYLGSLPLYLGGIPLYLAGWLLIPEEGSEQSIAAGFVRNFQHRSR